MVEHSAIPLSTSTAALVALVAGAFLVVGVVAWRRSGQSSSSHGDATERCLFCRLIRKEINSRIVHEDDKVMAFHDISPAAKHHIIVIPKHHISNCTAFKDIHLPTLERMKQVGESAMQALLKEDCYGLPQGVDTKYVMGFTKPPFNSINHAHMHVFTVPLTTNFIRGYFLQGRAFFEVDELIKALRKSQ
ncbi:HIT-like domain-containing protein [Chytridium lagenaria]|nr:HIT-like domain-containing protein [Chytridium lagenaria]